MTFTHGRCDSTSPNQHAERTSTPTPSDYTTQGDPDASPPSSSKTHDIKLGKEGRFSKKCIPRGYIPDFDWTTIHQSQDQPIKPIQQQDPTEDTTTPAAPTEVEGPPSSRLRSKTKQQHTSPKQEQPECNPT